MKKHLLKTLLVATGLLAGTLSSWAQTSTKTLYMQDFSTNNVISYWKQDATSNNTLTYIEDATNGNYLQHKTLDRSRYFSSTFYTTGNDFYNNVNEYTIEADLAFRAGNRNTEVEFVALPDGMILPNTAGSNYTGAFLFKLSVTMSGGGNLAFKINDTETTCTFSAKKWYHIKIDVNKSQVAYTITDNSNKTISNGTGTYTLPESVSYKCQGFYILTGRNAGESWVKGVNITTEVEGNVANTPTIKLAKINGKQRTYLITFAEGETLHYKLPEATEYVEVNTGTSVKVSTSTSGNLVAYTTNGSATSSEATTKVDASDISLNAPTYTVTGLGEGYEKEYTIAINNDNIPLKPTASLKYVFTPADGSAVQNGTINNGEAIKSTTAGTYDITASAEGYTDSKLTISNTVAYTKSKEYSFSTMTKDDFANETIWKEGTDTESRWGWSDAKPATKFELQDVESNASTAIEGIDLFTNTVPTIYIGYGLMAPYVSSGYGVIKLKNTNDKQCAVYTYLNNYGKNTLTTVQAANADYSLFRFSDILKDIKIYSPVEFATITDAKYATYVTKSAVVVPENVKVYTVKAYAKGIETEEVKVGTIIPANTAVLLNAETAGDYAFTVSTEAGTALGDNDLKAGTGALATGVEYCLTQQNGKVGFAKVKAGIEIPAGKAFLEVPAQSASANFFALDDTVTAIKNIETEKTEDNAYYTLQGVKVVNPAKGIYIHNGKKVVIK